MFKDITNYITGGKNNMIRVAIIKFPGDDNPHKYLCPNKNIDEGLTKMFFIFYLILVINKFYHE